MTILFIQCPTCLESLDPQRDILVSDDGSEYCLHCTSPVDTAPDTLLRLVRQDSRELLCQELAEADLLFL